MKFLATLVSLSVFATAMGDELNAKTHYASVFFGRSALIFGSQDIRTGGGFSYAYGRPEPRFQIKSIPAQFVWEGYYDHTHSSGLQDRANDSDAWGVLGYGRWRGRRNHLGMGLYFDFGWGFQYASRHTYDLDSLVNSTPFLGIGVAMPFGSQEGMLGIRYLHISNAGTVKPNRGQNELFFTAGLRF